MKVKKNGNYTMIWVSLEGKIGVKSCNGKLQGKLQGRGSQISGWDWLKHSNPGRSEKMRHDNGLTQGKKYQGGSSREAEVSGGNIQDTVIEYCIGQIPGTDT